jgi:hypothetical protein
MATEGPDNGVGLRGRILVEGRDWNPQPLYGFNL